MANQRQPLSLKGRALRYLTMREHSRTELHQKLRPHASGPDEIDQLLDELEGSGWLSAPRFVESVVHRKAARMGTARLHSELAKHQLPKDLVQNALAELKQTEIERALALWRKRYGHACPAGSATPPADVAKQSRFLASRGFTGDTIRQVLRQAETSEHPHEDLGTDWPPA